MLDWLLDSDPSIRWQVMRDLTDAPEKEVAAERWRVADEGWGAQLLDLQAADGQWGGGVYTPKWVSTTYTLLLLRHLGIDPTHPRMMSATDVVADKVTMGRGNFFDYASEMCVTGMALACASYFLHERGERPQLEHIRKGQRADGGWNCVVSSDRSSFHTTLSVLEGLLEYERAVGGDHTLAEAKAGAHEYLLQRRLMYSLSTGELIAKKWLRMSFPTRWFYDVARCLDYMRDAGLDPDPRAEEAVAVIESKRHGDGRWNMETRHPGKDHFIMEPAGEPSRWNTLRALRILRWYRGAEAI